MKGGGEASAGPTLQSMHHKAVCLSVNEAGYERVC